MSLREGKGWPRVTWQARSSAELLPFLAGSRALNLDLEGWRQSRAVEFESLRAWSAPLLTLKHCIRSLLGPSSSGSTSPHDTAVPPWLKPKDGRIPTALGPSTYGVICFLQTSEL